MWLGAIVPLGQDILHTLPGSFTPASIWFLQRVLHPFMLKFGYQLFCWFFFRERGWTGARERGLGLHCLWDQTSLPRSQVVSLPHFKSILLPVSYWFGSCFSCLLLVFFFSSSLSMSSFTCAKNIYIYVYIYFCTFCFFFFGASG